MRRGLITRGTKRRGYTARFSKILHKTGCYVLTNQMIKLSLASHTLYHCEKEGLVTLRTTSCVERQKSGATNHLRDLDVLPVATHATCNIASEQWCKRVDITYGCQRCRPG